MTDKTDIPSTKVEEMLDKLVETHKIGVLHFEFHVDEESGQPRMKSDCQVYGKPEYLRKIKTLVTTVTKNAEEAYGKLDLIYKLLSDPVFVRGCI